MMGRRNNLTKAPAHIREAARVRLIGSDFGDLEALAADLNAMLREHFGDDRLTVSKSGLQRFGEPFRVLMDKVKASGEAANALMEAVGDDRGALNDAIIRTVQTQTLQLLIADESGVLASDPKLMRAIATLVRASVTQKEWGAKVNAALDAETEKLKSENADKPDALALLEQIRKAYRGVV